MVVKVYTVFYLFLCTVYINKNNQLQKLDVQFYDI